MAKYFENLGAMAYDNLVNSADKFDTALRTILAGAGELKRGTALAMNSAGKMVILGTEGGTANCILAEDVTVGADTDEHALVYLTGHFNRNMLAVADGYEITAADVEEFRKLGIFLDNSVE